MRPALFTLGLALAAGAEAHDALPLLLTQGLLGCTLIWGALHG